MCGVLTDADHSNFADVRHAGAVLDDDLYVGGRRQFGGINARESIHDGKGVHSMKKILLLLLACVPCFAQTTLSIPAHSWTQPVTVNGITVTITLNEPAQTVPVPASGGSALPSGITWSNNVLTVAGTISATSVSLTGGPAIPT